jgi:hypothetical protein
MVPVAAHDPAAFADDDDITVALAAISAAAHAPVRAAKRPNRVLLRLVRVTVDASHS